MLDNEYKGKIYRAKRNYCKDLCKIFIEQLKDDQRLMINIQEQFPELKAYQIDDALKVLDWEYINQDENGWDGDYWRYYKHPDVSFGLTLNYGAFYGHLRLWRSDIDDE